MTARHVLLSVSLTTAVLLGTAGASMATAPPPPIGSDDDALAALIQAQGEVDAAQARITAVQDYLRAVGEPMPPIAPPVEQDTAAAKFGWGTPTAAGSDEFNYTGRPDPGKWNLPSGNAGCFAGHAGKGRRCAANSTVGAGVLTQIGAANGDTGWMQSKHNSYRGRWETRMRVQDTPGRDNEFHPVILLWPVAEDFPRGGEIDYSESTATSSDVSFFLHYGASNSQTGGGSAEGGRKAINPLDWHNYAVEWTASCVTGYIDGQRWFEDCNPAHLPPRALKASIQTDLFPDATPGPGETRMQVDWTRTYRP